MPNKPKQPWCSILLLTYGHHPELITQCLSSIQTFTDFSHVTDIRIGLNAVSDATQAVVDRYQQILSRHVPCHTFAELSGKNVGKYPMMRKMLYDPGCPFEPDNRFSTHVMWFDDDSYLFQKDYQSAVSWWSELFSLTRNTSYIGHLCRMRAPHNENQQAAIKAQPWYENKPIAPPYVPKFMTGGWWVADRDMLLQWDYPWPELHHDGGDTMLGEMVRQLDLPSANWSPGVAINTGKRRGLSGKTRRLWSHYDPAIPPDVRHQNFEVVIRSVSSNAI